MKAIMNFFFSALVTTATATTLAPAPALATEVNNDYADMPYMAPFVIVSDSLDASLEPGTVRVYGKVLLGYNYPVSNGTIATLDRSSTAITAADGTYSVLLTAADTAMFFYHPEYGETVIWNYKFQSQHSVQINFYMRAKETEPQMVKKPVIYLYSDKEQDVTLTLAAPQITFAYPEYRTGWKVKTLIGGGISDRATGKIYPYLFWEGEDHLYYSDNAGIVRGSLLATDTIVSFLENSLATLGLSLTEITDFITFWAPQLIEKDFVFIQFLVDEEYDQLIAGLEVKPRPDAQRRVFMQYTMLDVCEAPIDFQSQELSSFDRFGLTLVEWGGGEVSYENVGQRRILLSERKW